jgi:hypothetical protein
MERMTYEEYCRMQESAEKESRAFTNHSRPIRSEEVTVDDDGFACWTDEGGW